MGLLDLSAALRERALNETVSVSFVLGSQFNVSRFCVPLREDHLGPGDGSTSYIC